MEYRILGPLEVRADGRPIDLGAGKHQGVLALLLLHANEVVSSDRLIDELWGESPPSTARKALQVYVSQLRKLLGGNGEAIVTRHPGYLLAVDDHRLDAARFARLVADGRAHAAAGRLEQATLALRDALALWRGPPLDGLVFDSYADGYVERLEEERLAATMDAVDCELALGRHDRVVGELESLVARYPLQERLRGQHMLALYRAGRQADALAAYRDARTLLQEQLGLDPSAALQRLERAILTQDPALEAPGGIPRGASPPASPARPPQLVAGSRRRLLAPLAALAAVLAATVAAVLGTGDGSRPGIASLRPGTVGRVDPARNVLVAELPAGGAPSALTSAFGRLWAPSDRERTVAAVDPAGTPLQTVVTSIRGSSVAAADGALWIGSALDEAVVKVDPVRGATRIRVAPVRVAALASDGKTLWAAGLTEIARVDPRRAAVTWRGRAELGATAIAASRNTIWVGGDAVVVPFDPRRLQFGRPIATVGFARVIAVAVDAVWVAMRLQRVQGEAQLARIDPATRSVTMTLDVDEEPTAVAVGFGSVWVASSSEKSLQRFDARTGDGQARIELGAVPTGLAVTEDGLWVSVR